MTADTIHPEQEPQPLQFQTPKRDTTEDRVPFQLDDDPTVLYAARPKMAVLMQLGRTAADAEATQDERVLLALYDMFMDTVLEPETAAYLRERFQDPEDARDLDSLDPVLDALLGRWYQRPTGRQPASSGLPRTTGKRSTGRARSKGSTR